MPAHAQRVPKPAPEQRHALMLFFADDLEEEWMSWPWWRRSESASSMPTPGRAGGGGAAPGIARPARSLRDHSAEHDKAEGANEAARRFQVAHAFGNHGAMHSPTPTWEDAHSAPRDGGGDQESRRCGRTYHISLASYRDRRRHAMMTAVVLDDLLVTQERPHGRAAHTLQGSNEERCHVRSERPPRSG
jgi:hypothetical protein